VSTAIDLYQNDNGGTDNVWFYDMQADDFIQLWMIKRTSIADNDISILLRDITIFDIEKARNQN
jgi:hypothetical protein